MTELCDIGAIELRKMIGTREISPVELLNACRQRIDRINPKLNAVVATCWERAEAEAEQAAKAVGTGEPLGPLHGLPIGIKDTQSTAGVRTTFGSPIYADHIPEADERMVAAVRNAGAIVVGKTNAPEFGAGANTTNAVYGATGNPFDSERTCGGSSGGAAVALATGMLPLATGSDTGGSLRTPAAFCGVVGFRTSPGLVPVNHYDIGWSPLSVHGPITKNVAEAALMLSVIADNNALDPLSGPVDPSGFLALPEMDLGTIRVAFSEDLGFAPVDSGIRRVFQRAVKEIKGQFAVAEMRDPPLEDADEVFEVLRGILFLASHGERFRNQRDMLGSNIVDNVNQALTYSIEDAANAHKAHTALYRRFVNFMSDYDVLVTPAVTVPPFRHAELHPTHIDGQPVRTYFHWLALSYGITLTAHPSISIPCGLDETGTPFGIQLCGRRGKDRKLLGVAAAFERYLATVPALARPVPDLELLAV